jgi:sec-independent protein translocase protein TatA
MTATVFLMLSTWEIIAIVAVVLLLFGGAKIPELMRGLGKGVKEFKNAQKEVEDAINEPETKDTPTAKNEGK